MHFYYVKCGFKNYRQSYRLRSCIWLFFLKILRFVHWAVCKYSQLSQILNLGHLWSYEVSRNIVQGEGCLSDVENGSWFLAAQSDKWEDRKKGKINKKLIVRKINGRLKNWMHLKKTFLCMQKVLFFKFCFYKV